MRILLAIGLVLATAAPVLAQPAMPPAAEKALYCGDVLDVLSIEETNPARKAEYLEGGSRLSRWGQDALLAAGWTPYDATMLSSFADEVEEAWFGDGTLRYSVPDCQALAATLPSNANP